MILTIKLQNRVSLTIQLLKRFTIDHRVVSMGGFNFFWDGQRYPVLEFDGQNQTKAKVGWLKIVTP
jgi:DNA-binding transcriptional regulator/RsmH inhibitor MraZ